MTRPSRSWVTAGLPPDAYDGLIRGLPAARLWSLLLGVAEVRAIGRLPSELVEQWDRDRFVQPAIVDQRSLIEVDGHLLAAASAFESIELSPVAPLGVCTIMGHASQKKVLSALRGTIGAISRGSLPNAGYLTCPAPPAQRGLPSSTAGPEDRPH